MAISMREFFTEEEMPFLPILYRNWWDEFDRPSRLIDENFGLGLHHDDLIPSPSPRFLNYFRPWTHFKRQNSATSSLHSDKDKFEVILDVQQFAPNEITVKTANGVIIVEGKHEEKEDEHGLISRQFVRKYMLPSDVQLESITSNLSSDGVLSITVPKKSLPEISGVRVVPINQTGLPAARTPAVTSVQSPIPTVETPTETK